MAFGIYIAGLLVMIVFRSATFKHESGHDISEHEWMANVAVPIVWPIYVPIAIMWYFGQFIRKKYLTNG